MNYDKYMEIAIKEAKKAQKKGDVPVGAIIVKENKIISKAYNKKEKNKNAVLHAEIIAISKACKKLKTWRLDNCELYITLEPCMMCSGAILQSRIKKVIYGSKNEKYGYSKQIDKLNQKNNFPEIVEGILEEKTTEMIKDFFIEKR